jgi:hypothetical protein
MLIDVFEKPERFRLNSVGQQLTDQYGETITGKFADELELRNPLEYLPSQCSATIDARAPTYYQHGSGAVQGSRTGFIFAPSSSGVGQRPHWHAACGIGVALGSLSERDYFKPA